MALCHPERAVWAKGLCRSCYGERWKLRDRYDLAPEEYEFLLALQGGVCAICKTNNDKRNLHVDHEHASGAIRGLLCQRCNRGIGLLGDSYEAVERALRYLKSAGSN